MIVRLHNTFFLVLFLVVVLTLVAGCRNEQKESSVGASAHNNAEVRPVEKPAAEIIATQAAFIDVYARVSPAVVNISATRMRSPDNLGPLFENFFGEMFKRRPPPKRESKSLGSGFIISSDGFILTNEHVIKDAEGIEVKLADGRSLPAIIIGADARTDVAVIKVTAKGQLPISVLGNSDDLRVGQWALAIGNPFGLDGTLTVGVVSATERANLGIEDYEDFIQTDASINPGNSGGPLLNIYGEVVGINTAIVASGQGIGFAIPINLARLISRQLIEKGDVTRGWLGVGIQPVTADLADSFGLDRETGALVNKVLAESPAAEAGIQRGDILLQINGKEIRGVRELQLLVASTPVGKTVELIVLRDGNEVSLMVSIADRGEAVVGADHEPTGVEQDAIGIKVGPNSKGGGVSVLNVEPESPAATAGVKKGDVILTVNRIEVNDVSSFVREADKMASGENVVLLLRRNNATLYLAFPAS